MARPQPTPAPSLEDEAITPLQKLLTGTFLLSVITAPVIAFALYLSPIYKASGALYRGTYFVIGLAGAIALSAVISYLWMSYLPGLLERREARRVAGEAEAKAAKREADRKAREVSAQEAARRVAEEE